MCFAPLTLACIDAAQTLSALLHGRIAGASGDLAFVTAEAALGAIGPIALVAAFRLIFIAKPMRARWLQTALMAGSILFGVLLLAQAWAGWLNAYTFDFLCAMVLLSALPALGAAAVAALLWVAAMAVRIFW